MSAGWISVRIIYSGEEPILTQIDAFMSAKHRPSCNFIYVHLSTIMSLPPPFYCAP